MCSFLPLRSSRGSAKNSSGSYQLRGQTPSPHKDLCGPHVNTKGNPLGPFEIRFAPRRKENEFFTQNAKDPKTVYTNAHNFMQLILRSETQ
jgi:hypothetical protein